MKRFCSLISSIFIFAFCANAGFARPKIALVLSGGAARGLAEIPLLGALEEEGIPIDMVLGTSFGSIVGSMYCAGYSPKEIEEILGNMDYMKLLNEKSVSKERVPPSTFQAPADNYFTFGFSEKGIGSTPGLLGDQNIVLMLSEYFSRVLHITDFDRLFIPFRAVTTDAATGNLMALDSGNLVQAVRASMSLPLVWTPAPLDGKGYAFDGGLRNNLPVSVAKDLGADIVICMDVMGNMPSDPDAVQDIASMVVQVFDIVISNNAREQWKMADLTLVPELGNIMMMDFIHCDAIINAGKKCVEENRQAIKDLALKIKAKGVELEPKPAERTGIIHSMPDLIIEKVEVRDISLMGHCPLPRAEDYRHVIGLPLDEKTKKWLANRISQSRDYYHLSSLTYTTKPGSNPGSCILELQANHYQTNVSFFYLGGNSHLSFTNTESKGINAFAAPDFNVGFYLRGPVEIDTKIHIGSESSIDLNVYPVFHELDNLFKFKFDAGLSGKFGSLEPGSSIFSENRTINEDRGFSTNAGLQFTYIDAVNLRFGSEFDIASIHSTGISTIIADTYIDFAAKNLENPLVDTQGLKINLSGKYGYNFTDKMHVFKASGLIVQRFELKKNWNALGYDIYGALNRFPQSLTTGYSEYGGLDGMCGYSYGTFKRDFLIAGLTFQQKCFEFAGMPMLIVIQAKAGAAEKYGIQDIDFGAAAYATLKTPIFSLYVGGGANNHERWNITIGLN